MKRFLTRPEWRAWAEAGKPAMSGKLLRLACRSISLAAAVDAGQVNEHDLAGAAFEESLTSGDRYARKVLATRDREAGVMLLARAAGEDPDRAKIMAADDVDPELRAMWLTQLGHTEADPRTLTGPDPEEAKIMLGADPELQTLWLAQIAGADPSPTSSPPLGMDEDRYRLHQEAKQLAQTRCDANPRLDPAETYALAAIEIEDRKTLSVI